ncbi:hypothetical protein [Algoriphagus sp.]|uniref:hypothetical protein n=1 Tax=Algoriphagus sp. TaxID=1872435 RepID=UPI003F6E891D
MVKLFFESQLNNGYLKFELFSSDATGEIRVNEFAKPYFQLCSTPEEADWIFIPYLLSSLIDERGKTIIKSHAAVARNYGKPLTIVSDSDLVYDPGVRDIVILSPGPYASLGNQLALPAILKEDPIEKFHNGEWFPITEFSSISMGFCGQATQHLLKTAKDTLNLIKLRVQIKRKQSPYLYIPFFLAAYERAKLLGFLQKKSLFKTDFIFRKKYKAGANTAVDKLQVEKEFFENIAKNLFTVCLRGFGNYSVRFYQTLAMGRIPILIDTDNMLPFENTIDYNYLIVRVPFSDRYNIDNYISAFLESKSPEDLIRIQESCRDLWLRSLTLEGIFYELSEELYRYDTNK